MQQAVNAYFATQVTTTSQGDILIMLYDGAIKFLNQAKDKMAAKDYAQKGILISKAIDVIAELDSSLNAEKGGDLADNLHKLYFYCNTRLLKANMNMDPSLIDEVIKILSGLRGAFVQIKDMAGVQPQAPASGGGVGRATSASAAALAGGAAGQGLASVPGGMRAYGAQKPAPAQHAPAEPAPPQQPPEQQPREQQPREQQPAAVQTPKPTLDTLPAQDNPAAHGSVAAPASGKQQSARNSAYQRIMGYGS